MNLSKQLRESAAAWMSSNKDNALELLGAAREIDRLQSLVAELEKDKSRLDWLELNQKSIIHDCEATHDAWCAGLQGERQNTIRKAIDIEMEQPK